jgi:hypothetical protein
VENVLAMRFLQSDRFATRAAPIRPDFERETLKKIFIKPGGLKIEIC